MGIFHTKLHNINSQWFFRVLHCIMLLGRASKADLWKWCLL